MLADGLDSQIAFQASSFASKQGISQRTKGDWETVSPVKTHFPSYIFVCFQFGHKISIDHLTSLLGIDIIVTSKLGIREVPIMDKEEILKASRKDHRNQDLAELEVVSLAGSHAARVGALVCCVISLLSSWIARTMLYSPWTIYFSIIGTQWLVRFVKLKKKSDLLLAMLFLILTGLAFIGLIQRLLEVAP